MLLHGNSMMAIMTILFRVTTQRCSGQAMAARLFDKFVCGLFVGRVTVLKEYPIGIVGETLVHGTFYISGNYRNEYGEWDSCSLTDEQIEKYKEQFNHVVVNLPGIGLIAVRETKPEIIEPDEEFEEEHEIEQTM